MLVNLRGHGRMPRATHSAPCLPPGPPNSPLHRQSQHRPTRTDTSCKEAFHTTRQHKIYHDRGPNSNAATLPYFLPRPGHLATPSQFCTRTYAFRQKTYTFLWGVRAGILPCPRKHEQCARQGHFHIGLPAHHPPREQPPEC